MPDASDFSKYWKGRIERDLTSFEIRAPPLPSTEPGASSAPSGSCAVRSGKPCFPHPWIGVSR